MFRSNKKGDWMGSKDDQEGGQRLMGGQVSSDPAHRERRVMNETKQRRRQAVLSEKGSSDPEAALVQAAFAFVAALKAQGVSMPDVPAAPPRPKRRSASVPLAGQDRHELTVLDTRQILAEAISLSQDTKATFARKAGLNPSDLNRYLDGQHSMSLDRMQSVLQKNDVSIRISLSRD